ncbi:hypothetical protein [Pseudomonas sp. P1.8]|uniref:hypothetical protein n=1 Tax=Pseudomonas sp. P1.8 TaxID=1699310 RepID=UPI00069E8251|nr:hypothetical protein [Pseudomonas sp. P1.8]
MNTSAFCALAILLVSSAASATGVMPVFDLDFTRSADETLKKMGINDACIIGAKNPVSFTYCREGSSTLWKYQALDLEQLASIQNDAKRYSSTYQPISVIEIDSAACEDEMVTPAQKPTSTRWFALGLIALSLLISLQYSYKSIRHHRRKPSQASSSYSPQITEFVPLPHLTVKALASFGIAVTVAIIYFSCCRI